LLFAIGVIGTGLLAIPTLATLAGSSAYAVSEALDWQGSLEEKPAVVPRFYGVLAVSTLVGLVR
jgi:hypothetical protein